MQSTTSVLNSNAKPWPEKVSQFQEKQYPKKAVIDATPYQSPISPNRPFVSHEKMPPLDITTSGYAMAETFSSPNAVNGAGVFMSPYSAHATPKYGAVSKAAIYQEPTPEERYQYHMAKAKHDHGANMALVYDTYQTHIYNLQMNAHLYPEPICAQYFTAIQQDYSHKVAHIAQCLENERYSAEQTFLHSKAIEKTHQSVTEIPYAHQPVPKNSSKKSFGMSPLGESKLSQMPPMDISHMTAAELYQETGGGKFSAEELEAAENNMATPTPIAKKKPPSEDLLIAHTASLTLGDNLDEKATDLPDTRPVFERATSGSQTISNSLKTFITPTTATILAKVPTKYNDLLNELETALKAHGVTTYLAPGEITKLMMHINDTIMRTLYSQITDRPPVNSKTPSPTTLLTVLHEIRDKKDIKGKNHAKKLGIILGEIKEVMTTLKTVRNGQPNTENGNKLTEISRLFVAFFNKIGVLGVEALSLYESKLKKKIKNVDIPVLDSFFKEEEIINSEVFQFYAQQATGKKHLSGKHEAKKLTFSGTITTQNPQFKKDTHTISQRLTDQNQTSLRTVNLMDYVQPAKVSQGDKKRAMKAATKIVTEEISQAELRPAAYEEINSNDSSFVEDGIDDTNPNDISFQEDMLFSIRDLDDNL